MKPELEAYLSEHEATYAPQALRTQLLAAGYDPVEVDVALREWQARATSPASAVTDRRRFWRWALALHAAVLAVIGILSLVIGSFATNWGLLAFLAVVLLIGVGISGLIGRGATWRFHQRLPRRPWWGVRNREPVHHAESKVGGAARLLLEHLQHARRPRCVFGRPVRDAAVRGPGAIGR